MLFRDATGINLLAHAVKYETNALYQAGVRLIQQQHCHVQAVVCDGRKGLFQAFPGIPVQMCQFHQIAIIRRYLTKKPKLPAAQQLMMLTATLTTTTAQSFSHALVQWRRRWEGFLNERRLNPDGRTSRYVHKRLRSAYRSLNRNLPWLFTCRQHPELHIPNTTNAIDGQFSNLKNKLRVHNGLSKTNKLKFTLALLNPCLSSPFVHSSPSTKN